MRTRLFLFACFLAAPLMIFSQDEIGIPKLKPSGTYWGIGYYASGNIGLSNGYISEGAVQPGFGGTIEITHSTPKATTVLMVGKNILLSKYGGEHFDAVEFSIGPRFYFQKKSGRFAEITVGGIMVQRIYKTLTYTHEYNPEYISEYTSPAEFDFIISAGLGQEFKLNKNSSFIFKCRLINSFNIHNEWFTYVSGSAGIIFNSKNIKTEKPPVKKWGLGISLSAGKNTPDFLSKEQYGWGNSLGAGLSYRIFSKVDLFLDYVSNNFSSERNNRIYYEESSQSYSFGGRFLVSKSRATAFFEFGGGLYLYSVIDNSFELLEKIDENEILPGFTFGTGIIIGLHHYLDLETKGNLNMLLSEGKSKSPSFFTLSGGIRLKL